LAATVVQPLGIAQAFRTYEELVSGKKAIDEFYAEPNTRLAPASYPPIEELTPLP
jgi:hypothetical protein